MGRIMTDILNVLIKSNIGEGTYYVNWEHEKVSIYPRYAPTITTRVGENSCNFIVDVKDETDKAL